MNETAQPNLFNDRRLQISSYNKELGARCSFGIGAWKDSLQFTQTYSKGKEFKPSSVTISIDIYDAVVGALREFAKTILASTDLKAVGKEQLVYKITSIRKEDKSSYIAATISAGYSDKGMFISMYSENDARREFPRIVHYILPDESKLKVYEAADVTMTAVKLSAVYALQRFNHWDRAIEQFLKKPKEDDGKGNASGGGYKGGDSGKKESKPAEFNDEEFDF